MIDQSHTSPFDAIRRVDEDGNEYWSARDLARLLGYTQYNKFTHAIEKAKESCQKSGQAISDHFTHMSEMIPTGKDHGYMGLYDGRRENDIHTDKDLQPDEKILDFMGSEELAANMFRATQADAKLKRDQVKSKGQANLTHYQVGREVREAIKRLGGTMPEDLPTPEKSIQELQREEQKRIEQKRQPSLFDTAEGEQ
jgi:hypothetical protein